MIENHLSGPIDLMNQKEPFKKFLTLFQCTLRQAGQSSANEYVLLVLAREAISKGIIPQPYLSEFTQAINRQSTGLLQSLLYQIQDFYAGQPA